MGITIMGWVGIGFGVICLIAGIAFAIYFARDQATGNAIGSVVIGIVIAAACIIGVLIYSGTEAGKRAYKDQQSNFSGGINRTVTVYDINGNIIEQYIGEFDVETENANYILFDDENGKRHIILTKTGTIIIDEN